MWYLILIDKQVPGQATMAPQLQTSWQPSLSPSLSLKFSSTPSIPQPPWLHFIGWNRHKNWQVSTSKNALSKKTYLLKKLFLFVSTSQVCTNSRSSGPVGQRVYDLELCWALFVSAGCWCLVWAAASKFSSPFPSPSLSICPSFSFEMTHYCHLNP